MILVPNLTLAKWIFPAFISSPIIEQNFGTFTLVFPYAQQMFTTIS